MQSQPTRRIKHQIKSSHYVFGALISALLVFAMGCFFLVSNNAASHFLAWTSYNLSFDFSHFIKPDVRSSGVIIVYLDDKSYKDLGQSESAILDRRYYADLLSRLKQDRARVTVMDITFSDPGPSYGAPRESDWNFERALRSNGRVVLGADYSRSDEGVDRPILNLPASARTTKAIDQVLTFPYAPFWKASAKVGMVLLTPDQDFVMRKPWTGLESNDLARIFKEEQANVPPRLSLAAAQFLGLKVSSNSACFTRDQWDNYYGRPGEAIPGISLSQAYSMPPGFFTNKIIFVGARPITGKWSDLRDEARSPYYTFGYGFTKIPLVEVHATEFLNLLRGDWLKRFTQGLEVSILFFIALIFSFGLLRYRPAVAAILAVSGVVVILFVALLMFVGSHIWFPWMIIAVVQAPAALLCAIIYRSLEWYQQRRKLEAERQLAYERIREQAALLDKAQDAIIVYDLNWSALYWNKSAENLYGWSFEEVQKLHLKNDVFKSDENKLLEALQLTLANGEWAGELRQSTKAAKSLIVQSRWTLVRDEEGKPKSIFVINTDVTEQKKLESQFLRTQRMESIGTLAGGIAHDLNNVLSPILMGVEMMKMKANDEFTTKTLSTMASSAKRGSDMVKQVLAFARGHEGEKSVLQMSHLVREMQKIVKETFPKTIEFKTALAEGLWPVIGDATQIHQIILNLCVNARDAMPNGGQIVVSLKNVTLTDKEAKKHAGAKPIQYVLLAITDTGTGIPPEIMDKIFEPFFTTKEIGKGTGLGLSTVISIIRGHGGFLDLQSEVGKGTSFNVYIPAAAEGVVASSAPTRPEALRGEGETVMVVDDEPSVLDLTKRVLIHFGYKVVTAIHGADAVALFPQCQDKIKVLVIDMMMPVMDGPTAIRALRKLDPKLPVIAISGLMAGDKLKEQLGDVGVAFIPKPFTTEKLLLAVRDAVINADARAQTTSGTTASSGKNQVSAN